MLIQTRILVTDRPTGIGNQRQWISFRETPLEFQSEVYAVDSFYQQTVRVTMVTNHPLSDLSVRTRMT